MKKTHIRTKNYTGVYYREHETRKNGVKPDRYYSIRYTKNGKQKEEALGWASNGITELEAMQILGEIKNNIKLAKEGPTSLREKRDLKAKKKNESITFREWFLGGYTDIYLCEKKEKKKIKKNTIFMNITINYLVKLF